MVWFYGITRSYLFPLETLNEIAELEIMAATDDATVFYVTRR
jgi:hypothetical protein